MKLSTKVGMLTASFMGVASTTCFADLINPERQTVTRSLTDWVSLVAEILSLLCLIVFILYTAKFIKHSKESNGNAEENAKFITGIKNGVMTSLVGIAICQAVIIVMQVVFGK